MTRHFIFTFSCVIMVLQLTGCSFLNEALRPETGPASAKTLDSLNSESDDAVVQAVKPTETHAVDGPGQEETTDSEAGKETAEEMKSPSTPSSDSIETTSNEPTAAKDGSIEVVSMPQSLQVLVNKNHKLPETYQPQDLVYTEIPFIFSEKTDKRKLRKEAADAINALFTEAKKQGISLLGVSGYRSHKVQTSLFNYYVSKDGYEKARTYSALPGTSEHETGLSIDVTGGDGKCAAEDCFGGTKEAIWLDEHAAEFGFIIRYPEGKETITGYKYEPWHLRYVGQEAALEIMNHGLTLEEYADTVPVNK